MLLRNRCLQECVEDSLEHLGRSAVGLLVPQDVRHEAEGPLHLAIGEDMGAGPPVADDAETAAVGRFESHE